MSTLTTKCLWLACKKEQTTIHSDKQNMPIIARSFNELEEALASLGRELRGAPLNAKPSTTWYCENCGTIIRINARCRMCGKSEDDKC